MQVNIPYTHTWMLWASTYDGSLPRLTRFRMYVLYEPEETFGESVSMMLGGSLVTVTPLFRGHQQGETVEIFHLNITKKKLKLNRFNAPFQRGWDWKTNYFPIGFGR